jgi:His-Xaa-Ser system radical SAM maturase HxsC
MFVGSICRDSRSVAHSPHAALVVVGEATVSDLDDSFGAFLFERTVLAQDVVNHLMVHRLPFVAGVPEARLLENGDVVSIESGGETVNLLHDSRLKEAFVVVNQRCNCNCIMCPDSESQRRRDPYLSVRDLTALVSLLPDDLQHLTVTGGEPTIVPERLFAVLRQRALRPYDSHCLLLTNGRMCCYSDFAEELAAALGGRSTVSVPVHGPDAALHDEITRVQGSFDQTIAGIHNLLALGVSTEIRVVVSQQNYDRSQEIAHFVASTFPEVQRAIFVTLEMMGNAAKNRSQVWVNYEVLRGPVVRAAAILLAARVPVVFYNFPLCHLPKDFRALAQQSISAHKVAFPVECSACVLMKSCCGFFSSTLRQMKPTVIPIGA